MQSAIPASEMTKTGLSDRSNGWIARVAPLLCITLVAALVRLPYWGDAIYDPDEQFYSMIAVRMFDGAVPFVDLWDRKPIGLFLLYGAIHAIGGPGVLAYQLAGIASAALSGWLLYRLALKLGADRIVGTGIAILLLMVTNLLAAMAQAEIFFLPITIGMMALLVDVYERDDRTALVRRAFAIMALGGIMLQLKYNMVTECAFFGLAVLWRLWRIGTPPMKLAVYATGFAITGIAPTAIAGAFYVAIGHWDDWLFANFTSILERGELASAANWHYRGMIAQRVAPLAIVAALGLWLAVRRGKDQLPAHFLLVLGWTASAFVGAAMLGTTYLHYFVPVLPGLLLLALPVFRAPRWGLHALMIVGGIALIQSDLKWQYDRAEGNRAAYSQLVDAVAPYVDGESNCLYVFDGPPALYRDTGACTLTRFVFPDHMLNAMEKDALGVDTGDEMRRIFAQHPAVVVTRSQPRIITPNADTQRIVRENVAKDYVETARMKAGEEYLIVNIRADRLRQTPEGKSR